MITDKNGKEVSLKSILDTLVGTNDLDQPKAVIDFSIYPITEEKTLGNPTYSLVAANAIITQISFMGAFTLVEVDFRHVGIQLLQQVVAVVSLFHKDINFKNVIMISTVTSLSHEASHIMSLTNPLVCIRGYSEEGQGSTLLQLIYPTENIGFSVSEINYEEIDAALDREVMELESADVSAEILSAAQNEDGESEMQQIFKPDFIPDFSEAESEKQESVRISGHSKNDIKVVKVDNTKIKGVREAEEKR